MNTTYSPFCSEIPFLRTLRRPLGSATVFWSGILLPVSSLFMFLALPPFYWLQFLCLPACPLFFILLGLWGHAKGRKPLKSGAFSALAALCLLLLAALAVGAAGLWLPIPRLHTLCTDFLVQIGLPAAATLLAPLAFCVLAVLTLVTVFAVCKSAVKSIQNGLANIKGALFLGILLLFWSAVILLGGGIGCVFYTPQNPLLPFYLPFNLFLALAALGFAIVPVLWATVLFRVAGVVKKFKKF